MGLFTSNKTQDYTIIVGCGRLGAGLANTLSDGEGKILIIDSNKDSFRKLSPSYDGLVLTGDATEMAVLDKAQIKKATTVVAVTNNDNTNILISQMAKELFHTQKVIAQLYDPERESVYHEFGIDAICPSNLSTKEINELLHLSGKKKGAV